MTIVKSNPLELSSSNKTSPTRHTIHLNFVVIVVIKMVCFMFMGDSWGWENELLTQ